MENKKVSNRFFAEIIEGIRKASRQMAEKSAANNEELVIAGKDGKPVSIPAKELLKKTL